MTSASEDALARLGASLSEVREALSALDGTFIRRTLDGGAASWHFRHPTIREAFAVYVSQDPDLLGIFINGLSPEAVLRQLSLNTDSGRRRVGSGALIEVGEGLYPDVAKRLAGYDPKAVPVSSENSARYYLRQRYVNFLVDAPPKFLAELVSIDAKFGARLLPLGSYLDASPEARLLGRLHQLSLLDSTVRDQAAEQVSALAVETPDDGWTKVAAVASLLTPSEVANIKHRIRRDLLPELSDQLSNWRSNWSDNDDPNTYFDLLSGSLRTYLEMLNDDPNAQKELERALDAISYMVDEAKEEYRPDREPDTDDFEDWDRPVDGRDERNERDIFEDVDV